MTGAAAHERAQALRAEIERRLGYFPALFAPALAEPAVLEQLWAQTRTAYLDGPLPTELKEALLTHLARYCGSRWCLVRHVRGLRASGVPAAQVAELLDRPIAGGDAEPDVALLARAAAPLDGWPPLDGELGAAVLRCAIRVFAGGPAADRCRDALARALGASRHAALTAFLAYVRASHAWAEAHPEIDPLADPGVREELAQLARAEPRLARLLAADGGRVARPARTPVDDDERLAAVFASAPIATALVALDGCLLRVNDALCRLLGRRADELAGAQLWDLTDPRDVPAALAELRDVVAGVRASAVLEHRVRRSGGEVAWVSLHVSVVGDGSGGPHLVAQLVDVTERREIEHALREAEERFRKVFEEGPVGMALVDERLRFLEVNEALCVLTGYPAGELLGRSLAELGGSEDAGHNPDLGRRIFAGELPSARVEQRYVTKDGAPAWATLTATAIRDASGRVEHGLAIVEDVTERKRFEGQLRYFADHDPLTGLLNRRRFAAALERHVALTDRYGASGAIVLMDLDDFKDINDTLGHHAGDALIRDVARVMRSRLRATDELARIGGDEFAVLLPHASPEEAREVAESLRTAVARHETVVDGHTVRVTASVGVAPIAPGSDAERPLVDADIAMYAAKHGGRDRVAMTGAARAGARRPLPAAQAGGGRAGGAAEAPRWDAAAIRRAVDDERLALWCQPIADVATGSHARYELLVRIVGEDGRVSVPDEFLPVAEREGLVEEIDAWVLGRALELLAAQPSVELEINVSARSLASEALLARLEHGLVERPGDAGRLTLEVAERAAVEQLGAANRFARRVRELGCAFALDDFGSGFGSASYLKHVQADVLKIDGNFVRRLSTSVADQLLVRAIVAVARGLGQQTVAELVGSTDTLHALRELGVDFAQGDAIQVARPLEELLAPA